MRASSGSSRATSSAAMARSSGSRSCSMRARLSQLAVGLLPLAVLGHHFGQFAVRLGDLAVLVGIGDHGRIGHLRGELVEALFELFELLE